MSLLELVQQMVVTEVADTRHGLTVFWAEIQFILQNLEADQL